MPGPAICVPTGSADQMTTRRIGVSCLPRMRAVVVIPTLNACALLAEAVASIERQTVPVELVVVDNGSTDGTLQMLEERFPGADVVRNAENMGFGPAVNRGAAR